jgi:hypothetical protein
LNELGTLVREAKDLNRVGLHVAVPDVFLDGGEVIADKVQVKHVSFYPAKKG